MKLIRSFISLNIESSTKSRLKLVQDDIRDSLRHHKIKWEDPDKFHLTLQFLGDVEASRLDAISRELDNISVGYDSFKMTTSGIGFFPNRRRPNVIFISLEADHTLPQQLSEEIQKKTEAFGFKPDKKFVPHITAGRFRRENRNKVDGSFDIKVEPIDMNFDSFYLMRSTLGREGSVHEVIKQFKFEN